MAASNVMCRQADAATCAGHAAMRCNQKVRADSKSGSGQTRPKRFAQGWKAPVDT